MQYAKGFTIQYLPGCKVVTILSPAGKHPPATRYALVPRGKAHPAGFAASQVIETPTRSLVGLSSLHVALVDFLGATDVLVGLGMQCVSAAAVRQRIAQGKIFAVGDGRELNNELLISRQPDLVMATGWPGEGLRKYQTLAAAGIPVLLTSEWVETTPLGRAEWVQVLAALLNKEALVDQKFDQVAREYHRLAALVSQDPKRPRVIVNLPFKDVWYVPEAGNYMTQFLRDAGATYPWAQVKATGSLPLTVEAVVPVALTADFDADSSMPIRRTSMASWWAPPATATRPASTTSAPACGRPARTW